MSYQGWENCYRLTDGCVELVVTADVGPRVIRFGFVDGENEFWENERWLGKRGGDEWVNYGGHRLWHAPESQPRTYTPDNDPVNVEEHGDFTRFVQPVEPLTGIQKALDIYPGGEDGGVRVVHRLRNTNLWEVAMAPWALSVMAGGGTAILPLPPRGPHPENLRPKSSLILWAYTDLHDPRWTLGTRYILLRQDATVSSVQKIGAPVPDGWVAYAREGHLFVKVFAYVPGAIYPDLGASVELFTNSEMVEVETLSPMVRLAPDAEVEYEERWYLFDGVATPSNDEDVEATVLSCVESIISGVE